MRLTKIQKQTFINVLNNFSFSGELRLYGSRVNDSAKGGDIDLLLLVNGKAEQNLLTSNKYKILNKFKAEIGDQKIDLLIASFDSAAEDAFIKMILPTSILLYQWL